MSSTKIRQKNYRERKKLNEQIKSIREFLGDYKKESSLGEVYRDLFEKLDELEKNKSRFPK